MPEAIIIRGSSSGARLPRSPRPPLAYAGRRSCLTPPGMAPGNQTKATSRGRCPQTPAKGARPSRHPRLIRQVRAKPDSFPKRLHRETATAAGARPPGASSSGPPRRRLRPPAHSSHGGLASSQGGHSGSQLPPPGLQREVTSDPRTPTGPRSAGRNRGWRSGDGHPASGCPPFGCL